MTRLPASVTELRGLRAARWVRESTVGQVDNFGPDAQCEQQDRAIERFGLRDTGLTYDVAHSGRTIAATATWRAMLEDAGVEWDVLVVGYVSRFARDLETAVTARRQLHAAGAAILFADDGILTSDEEQWERWAREAVEAEAYSRRLGKRIREGLAAKRRRLGVPGGNRAPLGTVRRGRELGVDEPAIAVVRQAYELAAAGSTDRDVAARTGLAHKHVAEILTNPFYRGVLRTGEASALGPLVDVGVWEGVQAMRARYSRRHRGAVTRRQYALSGILVCASCGRRLIGHGGRMRHTEPCAAFKAAAPRRHRVHEPTNLDHRVKGESYPAELYDQAIGVALGHVAASSALIAETVGLATAAEVVAGDQLAIARIARERDAAALRFARDRDLRALEATMTRLDGDEAAARGATPELVTAGEARDWCEQLATLWRDTTTAGRRAIAEAVFERIEVLGVQTYGLVPTPAAIAHGWDAAFGPGVVSSSISQSGRGERPSASTNDLPITLRLIMAEPPPLRLARSA